LHALRAPRAGSSLTLSDLYLCAACRLPALPLSHAQLCTVLSAVLQGIFSQSHRLLVSLKREGLLVYGGVYTHPLFPPRRGRERAGSGYPRREGLGYLCIQMARHLVAGGNLLQHGFDLGTDRLGEWTARMEAAARGRVQWARDLTSED